jgi:hypothetical protein
MIHQATQEEKRTMMLGAHMLARHYLKILTNKYVTVITVDNKGVCPLANHK